MYMLFTSLRAMGWGQKDLWYSERIGQGYTDWSAPVNLGPTINIIRYLLSHDDQNEKMAYTE
ncbi:MAG: hypothetical protein A2161_02080 [Candidatus Schekmanbacteria bacterium RBG_13_48_7]|uniref:Uncharacterized protein n=1 Tax=Candidatus Schekmanbacteria bacterium RBG_13_48_7 TaxID=1817878 RepID=A0A1F7RXX7_9BACT|nr:MAG: hypothetical protein A2161_02080 [Candidatus Schekmanbacteria bacterium RBG_13_48_7]